MVANSDIFYVICGISSLINTAMLNNGWIDNLLAVMKFTKTINYHQENAPHWDENGSHYSSPTSISKTSMLFFTPIGSIFSSIPLLPRVHLVTQINNSSFLLLPLTNGFTCSTSFSSLLPILPLLLYTYVKDISQGISNCV
jgi:hypothetical protein